MPSPYEYTTIIVRIPFVATKPFDFLPILSWKNFTIVTVQLNSHVIKLNTNINLSIEVVLSGTPPVPVEVLCATEKRC